MTTFLKSTNTTNGIESQQDYNNTFAIYFSIDIYIRVKLTKPSGA